MTPIEIAFLWLAFAGLAASAVLFGYEWLLRRPTFISPKWVISVSGVVLLASVVARALTGGGHLFTGTFQLVYAAVATIAFFFVTEISLKMRGFGTFFAAVAAVLVALAQITLGAVPVATADAETAALVYNGGTWFHVSLITVASVMFLVAALTSGLYMYQGRALKRNATSLLSRRLPSLASLERMSSRAVRIGLPFYLAGQLLGALRAAVAAPETWWYDRVIMLSGIVSLVYLGYVVMYARQKASGQATAWVAVLGGVLVIVLAIMARLFPPAFHIFGSVS